MKTLITLLIAMSLANSAMNAEPLSPLLKIGQPEWRSFSASASGYGALGENREHVAVYVSFSESRHIHIGANAEVRLGAPEGLPVSANGRVISVLANADPSTGQAIVSIQIPHQDLPAHTYASASIAISEHRAIAIPPGALLMIEGRPFVFKQKGENNFEKVSVTIGDQTSDAIEITSGLRENDSILVDGAIEWNYKDRASGE